MAGDAAAPIAAAERIDMLDLLRGVAICGILLVNLPAVGLLWRVRHPPYPAAPTADWIACGMQHVLIAGSMRGLFTLLFGAGMLLMLRPTERDGVATPIDAWARRCIALMGFGIVQGCVFLFPGEILFNYGLSGLFLLAFRRMPVRRLLCVAGMGIALYSLVGVAQALVIGRQVTIAAEARMLRGAHRPLDAAQRTALAFDAEQRAQRDPPPAAIAAEVARRTRWPAVIGWSINEWAAAHLGGAGWLGLAESLPFMLIGMALLRTGVLTGARPRAFYARLALAGYGIGLPLRLLATLSLFRMGRGFDLATVAFGTASHEPARLLVTIGHVGAIVWLSRAGALGRAWPARALGRMALTTYALQALLTSALFYGLGLFDRLGFAALMLVAVALWGITGLLAMRWLRTHRHGPAERLLRRLAYGGGARPVRKPAR